MNATSTPNDLSKYGSPDQMTECTSLSDALGPTSSRKPSLLAHGGDSVRSLLKNFQLRLVFIDAKVKRDAALSMLDILQTEYLLPRLRHEI